MTEIMDFVARNTLCFFRIFTTTPTTNEIFPARHERTSVARDNQMTRDPIHCVTGAQLDLRGDSNTLGVILSSSTLKGLRRSSGSALKVPASSHLVHLLCNDRRIRLCHRFASHGLIVESAVVLVRVAMACTEDVIAATLEAGKPHSFVARETSVRANLFWSGLASPVDL